MSTVIATKGPIQLSWNEKDRQITLTPEDQDRFNLTVDEAIKACQAYDRTAQFMATFTKLINTLAGWAEKNKKKIGSAFVTVQNRELLFLIVQKQARHDSVFEDLLSELDLQIANDKQFERIRLDVLALPTVSDSTLGAFIDRTENRSIQVFPHAKRN
jgi:hypothetical protein